jgi:hypothetical protein
MKYTVDTNEKSGRTLFVVGSRVGTNALDRIVSYQGVPFEEQLTTFHKLGFLYAKTGRQPPDFEVK